jgi:hypothetical protein
MTPILLLLLALSEEPQFFAEDTSARICRTEILTGFRECTAPMDSRKANEYVREKQSAKKGDGYLYILDPLRQPNCFPAIYPIPIPAVNK